MSYVIDAKGCISVNITDIIAAMTGDERAHVIQSLACCAQVIDEVMNQVIDGSTTEGWYGPKGCGGNPDATLGIDGARMRIAKASSEIAAQEIQALKDELVRSKARENDGWDAYHDRRQEVSE
jgi:hypothetical protein